MTDETKGTSSDSGANSEGSGNSRGFIHGMPLQAFQAHQTAMDDLFNEVHGKIKESSDEGNGLAKAISQYQNDDMVWGNSIEEVEKKISSLPDNGGGGGGGSGGSDGNSGGGGGNSDDGDDGDRHGIAYGLVDRNTGTIVNVVMQGGERDREDVLDAMLAAVSHLRKELRSEESKSLSELHGKPDFGTDADSWGPAAQPWQVDPKNRTSVEVSLESYVAGDDIRVLARNYYGIAKLQLVRADQGLSNDELADPLKGVVVAECYNYGDIIHSEELSSMERDCRGPKDSFWYKAEEFCFNERKNVIPHGKYVVRLLHSPRSGYNGEIYDTDLAATTGQFSPKVNCDQEVLASSFNFMFPKVALSDVFEVGRNSLHTIKNFCKKTKWGYSTVHKAINDGTIPRHLVVEKTRTCSKRRVYMSADQCLLNSGKRKCRKHRRPNRRARTV